MNKFGRKWGVWGAKPPRSWTFLENFDEISFEKLNFGVSKVAILMGKFASFAWVFRANTNATAKTLANNANAICVKLWLGVFWFSKFWKIFQGKLSKFSKFAKNW